MTVHDGPPVTLRALNRATLARQLLLQRAPLSALAAIERLVALQAQVAWPPFVGLWARLAQFSRADLLTLLDTRKAVRATSLRGTIHVMSAQDFVSLRGAIQPALTRGALSILGARVAAVDMTLIERDARALFGKEPATFDAFRQHLKERYPGGDERAMAYALRCALPLVQVPTTDPWGFPAAARFAVADAWLKKKVPTAEQPAHELVRRYLAAFGPATPADAQTWSGLQGLRAVFEDLRPSLVTFRDERKRELFDLPDAPRPPADTDAPVRFLPEFDNLTLAYADRTRVVADAHRARMATRNLQVLAVFLVDGVVAGTWRVARTRKTAVLTVEPFGPVGRATRAALEEEGQALVRFVEPGAEAYSMEWPTRKSAGSAKRVD